MFMEKKKTLDGDFCIRKISSFLNLLIMFILGRQLAINLFKVLYLLIENTVLYLLEINKQTNT